jgi:DNA mismatch repair protein MutS2
MVLKDKNMKMLEFPKIRGILAGYTSFAVSKEMALNIKPSIDADNVKSELAKSAEARHLLSIEPDITIGGVFDIRENVLLAAHGKMLELESLVDIQRTLSSIRNLYNRINKFADEAPLLCDISRDLVSLVGLEKDIARCISPSAEILDDASDYLAQIRRELKNKRQQILHKLNALLKSHETEKYIQEPIITEREGRYVIPVKVETRREFRGIVHDISNTGATAFVEPLDTIDMGNELRELVIEEQHEIERILAALSEEVGDEEKVINRNLNIAAQIDLILAKAKFAAYYRAVEPILSGLNDKNNDYSKKRMIRLINGRHPLLKGKAVPLNIELGEDFRGLVITGPNTGGKTVALKTIGLLALMTQSGIPIPVEHGSCLPMFDNIFADIGDEQSIENTLSTFSSHIGNIVKILKETTDHSLVLLDELGTGTDPSEGAALAQSILLYLLSKKALFAATTHFSELKAFAHSTEGLQNASLDFDPVTNAPTYHLIVGIPGGSNALHVAAQLGLPEEIINGALGWISKGAMEVESLLCSLQSERQKYEEMQVKLERERFEAERIKLELTEKREELEKQEQKIISEIRVRLIREGDELQKQIRDALGALKKNQSKEKIEQARKALSEMRSQLKSNKWQMQKGEDKSSGVEWLALGQRVLLKDLNVQGEVISLPDSSNQIEVQIGNTRMKVSADLIESLEGKAPLPQGLQFKGKTPNRRSVERELDLRGRRADEVEILLDEYLDEAGLSSLSQVRIVHGYGTGTVRQIVRQFLAHHPLVSSFRSGQKEEGGDGVTVVSL